MYRFSLSVDKYIWFIYQQPVTENQASSIRSNHSYDSVPTPAHALVGGVVLPSFLRLVCNRREVPEDCFVTPEQVNLETPVWNSVPAYLS